MTSDYFTDQVAVITGASSGIGWALAKELSSQGCKIGLLARRQDQLDALAALIQKSGGTAAVCAADAGEREQVLSAIQSFRDQLGPVDLLIANAGIGASTRLHPMNTADTEQQIRVNLLGVVYAIEAVLPEMLARGRGHLAAVSSLAAYKGLPGKSAYCASKAAVNVYMEGLRIHLRNRGIVVTTICPGFIRTPMTSGNKFWMPWLMDADRAARLIVQALRRRRKVYNFPWQMAWTMKIISMLPDWIIARGISSHADEPPSESP